MGAKASTDTRHEILEAAKCLLRRHGNDKMTVVDIGRAMGMSHANVYRYFKTKAEILDAIIEEWLINLETFVEEIAHRKASARQRIEAIVLELHRKRKKKLLEDAEVFETFRRVVEVRPEVAARRREKILLVFRRLVEEGIGAGEFEPVDSMKVATALKDSTSLFLHPFLIPTILHEETDSRARNVVRFVLRGIAKADN